MARRDFGVAVREIDIHLVTRRDPQPFGHGRDDAAIVLPRWYDVGSSPLSCAMALMKQSPGCARSRRAVPIRHLADAPAVVIGEPALVYGASTQPASRLFRDNGTDRFMRVPSDGRLGDERPCGAQTITGPLGRSVSRDRDHQPSAPRPCGEAMAHHAPGPTAHDERSERVRPTSSPTRSPEARRT